MKRLARSVVMVAGALAVAGTALLVLAVPGSAAANAPAAQDNFAYGSYAPLGAITGGWRRHRW